MDFSLGLDKGSLLTIYLSDYIRLHMDKGHLVGMVLLDLQKAFNTVDHGILIMKLISYEFYYLRCQMVFILLIRYTPVS